MLSEEPPASSARESPSAPAAEPTGAPDEPEPTVGTGSALGIGCLALVLLAVVVLAIVFLLPAIR